MTSNDTQEYRSRLIFVPERIDDTGAEGRKVFGTLKVGDLLGKTREAGRYVIKKIDGGHIKRFPSELSLESLKSKWEILKKLGIPVVPIFRITQENDGILMTDVSENGTLAIVDTNYATRVKKRENPRMALKNYTSVISQIEFLAEKAFNNGNGVYLNTDAFAVVIDKQGIGKVYILDIGKGSKIVNSGVTADGETLNEQLAILQAKNFVTTFLKESVSIV